MMQSLQTRPACEGKTQWQWSNADSVLWTWEAFCFDGIFCFTYDSNVQVYMPIYIHKHAHNVRYICKCTDAANTCYSTDEYLHKKKKGFSAHEQKLLQELQARIHTLTCSLKIYMSSANDAISDKYCISLWYVVIVSVSFIPNLRIYVHFIKEYKMCHFPQLHQHQ